LTKLAKKYGISPQHVWQVARNKRWDISRATYRSETARLALEAIQQDEVGARKAHAQAARAMIAKGLEALEWTDPAHMSPRDAIQLIAVAADIERAAQGIATITEERHVDLSQLSDDDLAAVAAGKSPSGVGAPTTPSSSTPLGRLCGSDDT
jgi:hypothetical protein